MFYQGQDFAYRDPNRKEVVFVLGGKLQTAEAFRTKIASRFGGERNFRKAWDEATRIVSEAGEEFLKSGEIFYSQLYKPRRDDLVVKWTEEFASSRKAKALRNVANPESASGSHRGRDRSTVLRHLLD